jgi:hypothetical protein
MIQYNNDFNQLIRKPLPIANQNFRYQILTEEYVDQVVEVFTNAFCDSEPMTRYLAMDKNKYKKFASAVTQKALEDKLSIIALDGKKVIAFALVEDIADPGPIPDFDPKFKYILGLLENLGQHYFANKKFEKRQLAHLFITAVREEYRGLSLSTQVNFQVTALAQQENFSQMYCEFTHYYNEKGVLPYLKNYQLIGSQIYKNFNMENQQPFEYLDGSANSFLWPL